MAEEGRARSSKEGLGFRKSPRRSNEKGQTKCYNFDKYKSQVIKDIKLKDIMAFAGVSPIESTSMPIVFHAATPMQSDLINISAVAGGLNVLNQP